MLNWLKKEQKKEKKACSAFQVDNIPNNLIGKKIKTYARVILKISVVILFLGFASTFIYAGIVADEESSFLVYLMVLVVTNIIIVLTFVFSYFSFLLVSGFGAIIEDINGIPEIIGYKEIPYYKKEVESITIVDDFTNYNDDTL